MKNYFILLLVALAINASGQKKFTISGYITDAESGENLISANVFDGNSKLGTVSNLYGFYSISLPKDSVYLSFSYIGYESQIRGIFLDRDITLNVPLSSSFELDAIEIIAEDSRKIEDETQMSAIEVPVQQIKKMPAFLGEVDVLKTLQLLPGVQSGGEGQTGLYVRGGSPDQNLILLDGVPVYNANHLFGFFSVFNADAIKDVKLTKGGFPARYGGRLSSVLEINMKEGNKQSFHGSGSVGIISSKLALEGPIIKDKASFMVSGRRTYIDLLARPLISLALRENGTRGKLGYYFYDLNAKVNYTISDKDRIYLSAYLGDDRFYVDLTEDFDESDGEIYSDQIRSNLGWGNLTTALRWNHLWNQKLFSNVTATYSKYLFNTLAAVASESRIDDVISDRFEYAADYNSGIKDLALRVDFDYLPNPNHFIKFGGNAIRHSFDPGLFNLTAESIDDGVKTFEVDTVLGQRTIDAIEYNAFIEDDFKITPKLKINAGLHFSGFDVNDVHFTSLQPRLSIRQLFKNDLALKASFATMRQYVQFLTNENIGLPWDQWLPTTERVIPQDAWQAALGFAKTIDNKYELSVEAYYKEMQNLIAYKEGASLFTLENWEDQVSQGEGESYGAEFFVQKKKGRLTGWLGYTLSWSNRRFDDRNIGEWYPYKFDRRHDVSIVAVYELYKDCNVSATWVYGTGNAITFAESRIPVLDLGIFGYDVDPVDIYKSRNNKRMGAYHRLDVNIDFIKQKKKYKRIWSIGAYNAYSRKNPFFLNLETDRVLQDDGSSRSETVLRQYSLFPIIPSISYRFEF